jgi:hypothetical protein
MGEQARDIVREDGRVGRLARLLVVGPLLVAMVAAGCGGEGDEDAIDATPTPVEDPSTASDEPSTSDTPSDQASPSDSASDPASDDDTATPSPSDGATALPGEPWDGFAREGDVLAVVGVEHDDVLNIRSVPGMDGAVVTTAAPTADDLVATGEARQLSQSFWYEVTVDGVMGWASVAYLAFPGAVVDDTSAYLDDHERPSAETMLELGRIVAEDYASAEPPSRIVMSVAPSVGDLGEVSYDVIGIGDDSVLGFRLHVFATPDEGGEGFTLRTIELWTFCGRGSDGELCV